MGKLRGGAGSNAGVVADEEGRGAGQAVGSVYLAGETVVGAG